MSEEFQDNLLLFPVGFYSMVYIIVWMEHWLF